MPTLINGIKILFYTIFQQDDSIYKYKAHLVVKRFAQTNGIDYFDTFIFCCSIETLSLNLLG